MSGDRAAIAAREKALGAPVTIRLLGEPVAWARARPGRQTSGSGGFLITPKKQRDNAAMLRGAAQDVMAGRLPFDGPLRLSLSAEFTIPASWSQKKRDRAIRGEERPAKRPDLSNVLKQVEDAFNTVVFRDDALIVEHITRKVYSVQPKLVVTVQPLSEHGVALRYEDRVTEAMRASLLAEAGAA